MPQPFQKLKFAFMLRAVGLYKHLTLGARVAAIVEDRVLLVRHGYVAGWHLPGGGVDPGESVEDAGRRELGEETGYAAIGHTRLFSLYHSKLYTNRDHVALFIADEVRRERDFVPDREISEIGWFDLTDLPEDLSPATRRRLDEIAGNATISPVW